MKTCNTNPKIEEPLARMYRDQASPLVWLASLLTGDRTRGVETVIEVLDIEDAANPFFGNWMATWARKLVIANALDAMRAEMQASVLRTELSYFESATGKENAALPKWSLAPGTDRLQLERALLAIDLFPRCALLLMVFEKLSLDDAVILLNADRELVMAARTIGLVELIRNLADEPLRLPALSRQAQMAGQTQFLSN